MVAVIAALYGAVRPTTLFSAFLLCFTSLGAEEETACPAGATGLEVARVRPVAKQWRRPLLTYLSLAMKQAPTIDDTRRPRWLSARGLA